MAVFYPDSPDDMKRFVELNCNPSTHIVITDADEADYIIVAPVVTSQHRHYVVVEPGSWDPEKVNTMVKWLRDKGYRIVHGRFELRAC